MYVYCFNLVWNDAINWSLQAPPFDVNGCPNGKGHDVWSSAIQLSQETSGMITGIYQVGSWVWVRKHFYFKMFCYEQWFFLFWGD